FVVKASDPPEALLEYNGDRQVRPVKHLGVALLDVEETLPQQIPQLRQGASKGYAGNSVTRHYHRIARRPVFPVDVDFSDPPPPALPPRRPKKRCPVLCSAVPCPS